MFAIFIIWVPVLISLTIVLLNVSFLGIPQPKRATVAIVQFFDATSLGPTSHLLSLSPIFLLLLLWVTLPLSLMLRLFRCMFLFSLNLSLLLLQYCCLHTCLLHSMFISVGLNHQLLHLHHPYRLQIRCLYLHPTTFLLLYGKVNALALPNIL